ncbi:MAG: transposase [Clostridia bacterium]
MESPRRKQVRLSGYDYRQNGYYFITIRIYDGTNRLGDINDAVFQGDLNRPDLMVEKWLLELKNKYPYVYIDKYVIMPNHIHFILVIDSEEMMPSSKSASLSQIIGWFKTMTTNEYIRGVKNKLYKPFEVRFWQRGYHEHIISTQKSYEEIWRYIDENPLKWELDKYYNCDY